MTQLDSITRAAMEYYQLHRQRRHYLLSGFACGGAMILVKQFVHSWNEKLAVGLSTLFILGFVYCLFHGVAVIIRLMRFRCPRCNRRGGPSLWDGWPEATCSYCKLPAQIHRN